MVDVVVVVFGVVVGGGGGVVVGGSGGGESVVVGAVTDGLVPAESCGEVVELVPSIITSET